jgi:acetyl esterase
MLFDPTMIERLDPQIQEAMRAAPTDMKFDDFSNLNPLEMRSFCKNMCFPDPGFGSIAATQYVDIPGRDGNRILVKLYFPESPLRARSQAPRPLIAYFHGGGWVSCDIETHDSFCRALCKLTDMVVASVDYRLGPEAPFPAAPEDCYAATRWLSEHAAQFHMDPHRVVVAGDSAGGNLAAVVTLMNAERRDFGICHQLLLYPSSRWESWFIKGYLANEKDAQHPWLAPLLAPDVQGLPSATIVTAEFDGLNEQIDAYQEKLSSAGVDVKRFNYAGTVHGFLTMYADLDHARKALQEIALHMQAVTKRATT